MKKSWLLFLIIILGFFSYYFTDLDLNNLTGMVIKDPINPTTSLVLDEGNINVYFCPKNNCEQTLVNFINSAQNSIHCALFDIGLDSVKQILDKKANEIKVKVITDNNYIKKYNRSFVKTDTWSLMHNKFCIIDNKKISTGSMNPTNNGAYKNNNNLILINSKILAQNYEDEFQEMWNGTFKKGKPILNPKIKLNNIEIENYFCPEDKCANQVKEELNKAQTSIHFMTFSFTHDGIANTILLRNQSGVSVKGIFEARQVSKYSKYELLKHQGLDVIKDNNKNNMHHKVFLIDNQTTITGSFNPSNSGDKRNDENILIIHSEKITKQFLDEFENIFTKQT